MTKKLCIYAEIELPQKADFDEEVHAICDLFHDKEFYKEARIHIDSRETGRHCHSYFSIAPDKFVKEVRMFPDAPATKGFEAANHGLSFIFNTPKLFFGIIRRGNAIVLKPRTNHGIREPVKTQSVSTTTSIPPVIVIQPTPTSLVPS